VFIDAWQAWVRYGATLLALIAYDALPGPFPYALAAAGVIVTQDIAAWATERRQKWHALPNGARVRVKVAGQDAKRREDEFIARLTKRFEEES
jgi:hypothetical protein